MALYHYELTNNQKYRYAGTVNDIEGDYIHYEYKSFGESTLYYKVNDGTIADIIADSEQGEQYARQEVLDNLDAVKSIE